MSPFLFYSKNQNPLSIITCYTLPFAKCIEQTSVDAVLVGDSLGEVLYGFPNTTYVSMEMMIQHTMAVRRGFSRHIIVDMPSATYDDPVTAIKNAQKLVEAGGNSVKLENPSSSVVEELVREGIVVLGHVGLTPQTVHDYYKVGKTFRGKIPNLEGCKAIGKGGVCCIDTRIHPK